MDKFTWSIFCLNDLQEVVKSVFTKYSLPCQSLVICKRNRNLKDGDVIVPAGLIKKDKLPTTDNFQALLDELTAVLKQHKWKISKVCSPLYCLIAFHFNRESLYNSILNFLWTSDILLLKTNAFGKKERVWINIGYQETDAPSTGDLRSFILLQHVIQLLKCNGYDVSLIPVPLLTGTKNILQKIGLEPCDLCCEKSLQDKSFSEIVQKYSLQKCKYLKKISENVLENVTKSHCDETGDANSKTPIVDEYLVDLKLFIEESDIKIGKGNFEKSLQSSVFVSNVDGTCTEIMQEVLHLQQSLEQSEGKIILVHLNSEKKAYNQQKIDLLWKALFGKQTVKQIHINYGPVSSRQGTSKQNASSADEFLQLRFQQMKDAAVMKYGDKVKGPNWEDTIYRLTVASMKFEFLVTNHRNTVKLDLSQGQEFGGGVDNTAGAFVMYNCARLSTLFKHFDENVGKGVYPPLPDISSIDFSTLKEEDEWELFYNYIFVYPELIIETTKHFSPENVIISKVQTQKVCNFLIGLSRHLSSYYSRTHVLGENQAHLLSTMYARLYLLKTVHRIMCHGLGLLGISPLQQL